MVCILDSGDGDFHDNYKKILSCIFLQTSSLYCNVYKEIFRLTFILIKLSHSCNNTKTLFGCGWIPQPKGAGAATVDLHHPNIEHIPWSCALSTEIESYFERGGRSSGEDLFAAPRVAGLSSSIS